MPDQGYPNNLLSQWILNNLWGGDVAGQISPAWLTFINGWVWSIAGVVIKFVGAPWSSHNVWLSGNAVVTGDMLAVDLTQDAADSNGNIVPYIGRYADIVNGGGKAVMCGMAIDTTSANGFCTMAGYGPVQARYTQIPPGQTAGNKMTTDLATNKLRVANAGEEVHAYVTPKGNIVILGPARAA